MNLILNELSKINNKIDKTRRDNWLTLKDTIHYTTLSESTLRRATIKGELKVSRKTGKLLFKQSWIDRWLNG